MHMYVLFKQLYPPKQNSMLHWLLSAARNSIQEFRHSESHSIYNLFRRDTFSVAKLRNKFESMYISAHILFVSCPAKLFIRWFITYNGVKHVAHKSLNHTHIAWHPNLFERDTLQLVFMPVFGSSIKQTPYILI